MAKATPLTVAVTVFSVGDTAIDGTNNFDDEIDSTNLSSLGTAAFPEPSTYVMLAIAGGSTACSLEK
jgi:hypothetical protein